MRTDVFNLCGKEDVREKINILGGDPLTTINLTTLASIYQISSEIILIFFKSEKVYRHIFWTFILIVFLI
jgi:hypothetical protein